MAELILTVSRLMYNSNGRRNCAPADRSGPFGAPNGDNCETKTESAPVVTAHRELRYEPSTGKLVLGDIGYIQCISAACAMFISAHQSTVALSTLMHLGAIITDIWPTPSSFSRDFLVCLPFFTAAMNMALEMFSKSTSASTGSLSAVQESNRIIMCTSEGSLSSNELRGNLFSLRWMFTFYIKVIFLSEDYECVVRSASTLLDLYLSSVPDLSEELEECIPLMIDSQSRLLDGAEKELARAKEDQESYVSAYYEAQRVSKKKKMRIPGAAKDPEEEKFEMESQQNSEKVEASARKLEKRKGEMDAVNQLKSRFLSIIAPASVILSKIKSSIIELIQDAKNQCPISEDFGVFLITDQGLQASVAQVLKNLNEVERILTNKPDKRLHFEVKKVSGDFFLLMDRREDARLVYHQALDGLFSCLDAHLKGKSVAATALKTPIDQTIHHSVLDAIAILGKLSSFCCPDDWSMKLCYSQFAGDLSTIPFLESAVHPQSLIGFAAYIFQENSIGGFNSMIFNLNEASLVSLTTGATEVISVLINQRRGFNALPLIVIMEMIHSFYTRRLDLWLLVRLQRISVLIDISFFSEAISMLSEIKLHLTAIHEGCFGNQSKMALLRCKLYPSAKEFDTSVNGLNYYGIPPFFNNLPPDADLNKLCISKLAAISDGLLKSLPLFIYEVPSAETVEGTAANTVEKPKMAVKGKLKTEVEDESIRPPPLCKAVFDISMYARISFIFAKLLAKLGATETRILQGGSPFLKTLLTDADIIVGKTVAELSKQAEDLPIVTVLLAQMRLLSCEITLARHLYNEASLQLRDLSLFLKKVPCQLNSNHLQECGQLWNQCACYAIDIFIKQGKHNLALRAISTGLKGSEGNGSIFYYRKFLHSRALLYSCIGKLENSKADILSLFNSYHGADYKDEEYVDSLLHLVSINRALGLRNTETMAENISLLRKARTESELQAKSMGFGGAEMNMTFDASNSMVIRSSVGLSPLLASFLSPTSSNIKCGPLDESAVYCTSPFANIYLTSTRKLLIVHCELSLLLDDVLTSPSTSLSDHPDYPKVTLEKEMTAACENGLKVLLQYKCFDYKILLCILAPSPCLECLSYCKKLASLLRRSMSSKD